MLSHSPQDHTVNSGSNPRRTFHPVLRPLLPFPGLNRALTEAELEILDQIGYPLLSVPSDELRSITDDL